MTGLIYEVYLALAAVGLLITGGLIVWPVARRFGERQHIVGVHWEPVDTPAGRRWSPVPPPRPTRRDRLHAWWQSTAPRDVHAPVRAAMRGYPGSTPWGGE